jgi:hypothetical protein
MPKITKRNGLVATLVVAGVVASAAVAAVATGEPDQLDCGGPWEARGIVEAARTYDTPDEAAMAFITDPGDGKKVAPSSVELVSLSNSPVKRIAARVNGKTQAILNLSSAGGWHVEGFSSC